jgi:type IV pilus assembly protein PilB
MGIESFLLSSAISAVMSQRLVRRVCEHCREWYEPAVAERAFYERFRGSSRAQFVHGAGCNICSHTGYLGRIGAYELLRVTEEIRAVLVGDGSVEHLHQAAVAQGMRPMRDEVLRMVDDDVTTIAEAIRCVSGI